MHSLTRRSFLKTTAVVSAGAALAARSWAQVPGANGDVRVAVVGLNGRGRNHLGSLARVKGVRVVALCDVDSEVLAKAKAGLPGGGADVKTYADLRDLLASPDIDAVTIATPNHLHSLQAIWACQAGKDVYVEKPVSHNVWEGRQLVAAAAKYHRVVQAGTQIRSGTGLQEAVAWVQAGNLGRITAARGFCYKRRDSIGKVEGPQPVPASINYDLWCGPVPKDPLKRRRLHYDWHWVHVTGNGDVGNQGIHQMDVARWFLGEKGLPRQTLSFGGRLGYVDDGNTPNTQVVFHDYATAPLIFEVRGLPSKAGATGRDAMDKYHGVDVGNVIDCEGGRVVVPEYFSAKAYDKSGALVKEFKGSDRHMQNFIDVVRSRKTAELYGRIEEGHVSSALCHLGNISHVLGAPEAIGRIESRIAGHALQSEAVRRMVGHLAANGVDVASTPLVRGLALSVDAARERFTGDAAAKANPLLTRPYRAPFVVPDLSSAT